MKNADMVKNISKVKANIRASSIKIRSMVLGKKRFKTMLLINTKFKMIDTNNLFLILIKLFKIR